MQNRISVKNRAIMQTPRHSCDFREVDMGTVVYVETFQKAIV